MTSYNREKYIAAAIESLQASTYQQWELIIVDDQSKDSTVAIAQAFAAQDARIRVYVNEKNLGDYPNRNRAASYAKGNYLKYLDADDLIYPHGLEVLVRMMEANPEAGYGLCTISPDKQRIYPFLLKPQEAYYTHYFQYGIFTRAPLSSILRREVFEAEGGFSGERLLGDFEMWHRLSLKYSVLLMPQGLIWYREHDEQESFLYRHNPYEPFKYTLTSMKYLTSGACPLTDEHKQQAISKIKYWQSRAILGGIKNKQFSMAKKMSKEAGITFLQAIKNILPRS